MAAKTQLFVGPESVQAARALSMAIQERRDDWPFPHVYPPVQSDDVHQISTVVTPSLNATATVLSYQVQRGRRFYLRGLVFQADISFAVGAGLWTLARNPLGTQLQPEEGLVNVPVLLGSFLQDGWWRLARAREFEPLDVVNILLKNVSLGVGAGNNLIAAILGYTVPAVSVRSRRNGGR